MTSGQHVYSILFLLPSQNYSRRKTLNFIYTAAIRSNKKTHVNTQQGRSVTAEKSGAQNLIFLYYTYIYEAQMCPPFLPI